MYGHQQVQLARRIDLVDYLTERGFNLIPEGKQFRVAGYGGLIITGNTWYWHSVGIGGNAIDFLMQFFGMGFAQAVDELLRNDSPFGATSSPAPHTETSAPKHCFQPLHPSAHSRRVLKHLVQHRGLPIRLVAEVMRDGLLYSDNKCNAVFPCLDSNGQMRGAVLCGSNPNRPFKGMAAGSDSSYGWLWAPKSPSTLTTVTESPIDAMSLAVLRPLVRAGHLLSLNGLRWQTLTRFLVSRVT
ncbi:MAG: DUF3991 domain-containing protein [Firmicutes bacterium]|nr:DUF3991 domain-containing protein [Bacillota bacterium]